MSQSEVVGIPVFLLKLLALVRARVGLAQELLVIVLVPFRFRILLSRAYPEDASAGGLTSAASLPLSLRCPDENALAHCATH